MTSMQTRMLGDTMDLHAPDGSEIRLLVATERGSMVHCRLPPGGVSQAVVHRSVEEVWYFVQGQGEVWRKAGDEEEITAVTPGMSLNIPVGTHFQFRALGAEPLAFLITTMPPWPGEDEAVRVADHWPVPA